MRKSSVTLKPQILRSSHLALLSALIAITAGLFGFAALDTAVAATAPKVDRAQAELSSKRVLRKSADWRNRDAGYLRCANGRVNRVTWICRFGYVRKQCCGKGRSRVVGTVSRKGKQWFRAYLSGRRYTCVGAG